MADKRPSGSRPSGEGPKKRKNTKKTEYNLLSRWMDEDVKQQFPDAKPPKQTATPGKDPSKIIKDRNSDWERGLIREDAPPLDPVVEVPPDSLDDYPDPDLALQGSQEAADDEFDPATVTEWSPESDAFTGDLDEPAGCDEFDQDAEFTPDDEFDPDDEPC